MNDSPEASAMNNATAGSVMNKTYHFVWFCVEPGIEGTVPFVVSGESDKRQDYEMPDNAVAYQRYTVYDIKRTIEDEEVTFNSEMCDIQPFTYIKGRLLPIEKLVSIPEYEIAVENMRQVGSRFAIEYENRLYPYNPDKHNIE